MSKFLSVKEAMNANTAIKDEIMKKGKPYAKPPEPLLAIPIDVQTPTNGTARDCVILDLEFA